MLTFLRKLRRSYIESGSTRKYSLYAIGEIALVVIGILIALQINNWNETRKQKEEEGALLIRLQSEFQSNQDLIGVQLKGQQLISFKMRSLLGAMGVVPKQIPRDSLVFLLEGLSYIPKYTPQQGSLSSIISSGKITLISNEELNVKLTQWPGMVEDYYYHQGILYDISKQQWLDLALNTFPFRENQIDLGFGSTGNSKFEFDQNKILSSMAIETLAEFKRVDSEFVVLKLIQLQKIQEEILELIQTELQSW